MEMRIENYKKPEKILFNYEQLKGELTEKVAFYEAVVYDEEQIKNAKADKASLNKLKKAMNDERIRQEKEYLKPFEEFKTQVNELIKIIDKPIQVIDTQVKNYEEKQKAIKKEKIIGIYESIGFPAWVDFGKIFDEKWLNATVKEKAIQEALTIKHEQILADLTTLERLPEFSFVATEEYKRTLDINRAIAEGHRHAEIEKAKAEAERAKEERAKAEAEKAKEIPIDEPDTFSASLGDVQEETVKEPCKQWLSFKALLSIEDAQALKDLFLARNIKFESI